MFQGNDEQQMLANSLRRLISDRYSLEEQDRFAAVHPGFDPQFWCELVEVGAVGALFGPESGGYGGTGRDVATVFEEIGRGGVASPLLSNLLGGTALLASGAPAAASLLEGVVSGKTLLAFAHQEPRSRYSLNRVKTSATREGAGWVLNGTKSFVHFAEGADWLVVTARTSGEPASAGGISLFLVPGGTSGIEMRGYPGVDGGRAAEFTLTGVVVGKDALLGEPGEGTAAVERAVGKGLLALCADALGAFDAVTEATADYLRTRVQFGQPIGSFQALQHRMATMLIEIEQARSSLSNAIDDEALGRTERERALSAAKYTFGRVATLVAEEAVQMHGGIGMTWELPVTRLVKRLMMLDHQFGDTDHHVERYIELGRLAA